MIRVLVVDDQALVRGGIIMLLSGRDDIEVVGQAATGDVAVGLARELRPDVVIMDLRMPGLDGVEATRALTAEPGLVAGPDRAEDADHLIKVLALTTFNDDASVYGALRAGASGFLVKDNAPEQLVDAVSAIAHGDSWIDRTVAGQVIRALAVSAPSGGADASLQQLTARERQVLVLMADGLSNAEISARFVLSEATVRTHVSRILMKTGSRDRTQAVVLAFRSGLVAGTSGPAPKV